MICLQIVEGCSARQSEFVEVALNIVSKEPILEGWSNDKKYRISNEKGERFLLRVSDMAKYDTKQSEFVMMQRVASLGVPMCLPIGLFLTGKLR